MRNSMCSYSKIELNHTRFFFFFFEKSIILSFDFIDIYLQNLNVHDFLVKGKNQIFDI